MQASLATFYFFAFDLTKNNSILLKGDFEIKLV